MTKGVKSMGLHQPTFTQMIYITWHDAAAYARWIGKYLPTEKMRVGS